MVGNEIVTADQVLGLMLDMDIVEYDKLCKTLVFDRGIPVIRNQIENRDKIRLLRKGLGSLYDIKNVVLEKLIGDKRNL